MCEDDGEYLAGASLAVREYSNRKTVHAAGDQRFQFVEDL